MIWKWIAKLSAVNRSGLNTYLMWKALARELQDVEVVTISLGRPEGAHEVVSHDFFVTCSQTGCNNSNQHWLAQVVEHQTHDLTVIGSIPIPKRQLNIAPRVCCKHADHWPNVVGYRRLAGR